MAMQFALAPPYAPAHDQLHGPAPETALAPPVEQRLLEGAVAPEVPFADPHTPLTGTLHSAEEQLAVLPPLAPAHVHVHGPLPATALAEPVLHSADAECGADA